jgi:hypothetical protein
VGTNNSDKHDHLPVVAPDQHWRLDAPDDGRFWNFYDNLKEIERATLQAALDHVLAVYGNDICSTSWGKALGGGLYEFRIRLSLDTILREYGAPESNVEIPRRLAGRPCLLRVFCTFHGDKIILLLGGYNKGKDPPKKRQNKEISRARRELKRWRNARTAGGGGQG